METYPEQLRTVPVPVVCVAAVNNNMELVRAICSVGNAVTTPDGKPRFTIRPFNMAELLPRSARKGVPNTSMPGVSVNGGGLGGDPLSGSGAGGMAGGGVPQQQQQTSSTLTMLGGGSQNEPAGPTRRTTYDSSSAASKGEGFLRRHWLTKKTQVIPSVCLVAADMLQLGPFWKDQLSVYMDSIRPIIRYRNMKPIFLLFNANESSVVIDEKMMLIRKAFDSDPKHTLVPSCDPRNTLANSMVYALLDELSAQHYKEEAARKRSLLKSLPKSASPVLHARVAFKCAYISEFRHDFETSTKYYNDAYDSLIQARNIAQEQQAKAPKLDCLPLFEAKSMADWVNLRLITIHCQEFPNAGEALAQFQKHIKAFGQCIALGSFEFVHWGWVAKQYEIFAQLLETNPTVQAESREKYGASPWVYYQAASRYTAKRKFHVDSQAKPSANNPQVAIAREVLKSVPIHLQDPGEEVYVGQFSSRKVQIERDDPNWGFEEYGYRLVAWDLYFFEHSLHQLTMLHKAQKSLLSIGPAAAGRALNSIHLDLSIVHLDRLENAKAKEFSDMVIPSLRQEKWWELLTQALDISRLSSIGLGHVTDYVTRTFELLQPEVTMPEPDKQQLLFGAVLAIAPPSREKGALSEPLRIDLGPSLHLFDIEVFFSKTKISVGNSSFLTVTVKSALPGPITISSISATFNQPEFNWKAPSSDLERPFEPAARRLFTFEITPPSITTLYVEKLTVTFGTPPGNIDFVQQIYNPENPSAYSTACLNVVEHESKLKLSVNHLAPAFNGENYRMELVVVNEDEYEVTGGEITFDSTPQRDSVFYLDSSGTKSVSGIPCPKILPKATFSATFFARIGNGAEKQVTVKVAYDSSSGYKSSKTLVECIPIQSPFTVKFHFYTTALDLVPLSTPMTTNEPFFLCVSIQPTRKSRIAIHSAKINLRLAGDSEVKCLSNTVEVLPEPMVLTLEGKYTLWYKLLPLVAEASVPIGTFSLQWNRYEPDPAFTPLVQNLQVSIPKVKVVDAFVSASAESSPTGVVGGPMAFTIKVTNFTNFPQECKVHVDEARGFAIAGLVKQIVIVPPKDSLLLPHFLVPLIAGEHTLPSVRVYHRPSAEFLTLLGMPATSAYLKDRPVPCAPVRSFISPTTDPVSFFR